MCMLQVLQLLWDLSHLPALSTHLIELALEEHLAILNDSYIVKDQVKRSYVSKCVDDIKKVGYTKINTCITIFEW